MTNGEKYKDDILVYAYAHDTCGAFYDNNKELIVQGCSITPCDECIFSSKQGESGCCNDNFIKWVHQQYIDVDWKNVPIDTKVLVSHGDGRWVCGHFAGYNEVTHMVSIWMYGKTSFTIMDKNHVTSYKRAKLYKVYENNG